MRYRAAHSAHARFIVATGWALIGVFALLAAWQGRIGADVGAFQLAFGVGFVGYVAIALAVFCGGQKHPPGSWTWWFAGSLSVRLITLSTAPSDDVYRYVWEGRVQLAGVDPYVHPPNDDRTAHLRDEDWAKINHPDYPAIYGPVAELQFRLLAAVSPTPGTFKLLFTIADALVILVLTATLRRMGRPPHAAFLYGLCPLVLTAFSVEGHVDSVMLFFLACATWAQMAQRPSWSAAMVGLAVSTKLVAVVLVPWFVLRPAAMRFRASRGESPEHQPFRGVRPSPLITLATVVLLCHMPYLSAGTGLFGSLARFAVNDEFFSLPGTLRLTSYDTTLARWSIALLMGVIVCAQSVRAKTFPVFGMWATGTLLMLMPVVHYWYLTWVLLWMPLCVRWRWIVASLCIVLYFQANRAQEATGIWIMPGYAPLVFWSSYLMTWVVEAVVLVRARVPQRAA